MTKSKKVRRPGVLLGDAYDEARKLFGMKLEDAVSIIDTKRRESLVPEYYDAMERHVRDYHLNRNAREKEIDEYYFDVLSEGERDRAARMAEDLSENRSYGLNEINRMIDTAKTARQQKMFRYCKRLMLKKWEAQR